MQLSRSNLSAKERKEFNAITKTKIPALDSDGDGVPDHKDCKPFDKDKQGRLHDFTEKVLKYREERLEHKREKEMRKLEDLKDKLHVRHADLKAKSDHKNKGFDCLDHGNIYKYCHLKLMKCLQDQQQNKVLRWEVLLAQKSLILELRKHLLRKNLKKLNTWHGI